MLLCSIKNSIFCILLIVRIVMRIYLDLVKTDAFLGCLPLLYRHAVSHFKACGFNKVAFSFWEVVIYYIKSAIIPIIKDTIITVLILFFN